MTSHGPLAGTRHPEAETHVQQLPGDLQRLGEAPVQGPGQQTHVVRRKGTHQHHEFVAPEAGQHVGRVETVLQPGGHRAQHLVAHFVTERLVDAPEAVDPDHDHGGAAPPGRRPVTAPNEQRRRALEEGGPVREPRERIEIGEARHLALPSAHGTAHAFETAAECRDLAWPAHCDRRVVVPLLDARGGEHQAGHRRGEQAAEGVAREQGEQHAQHRQPQEQRYARFGGKLSGQHQHRQGHALQGCEQQADQGDDTPPEAAEALRP